MIHMYTPSSSYMVDLWVNLDKRFQEPFVQLYICTFVSLYLSSEKKLFPLNISKKKKSTIQITIKIVINSKNQCG